MQSDFVTREITHTWLRATRKSTTICQCGSEMRDAGENPSRQQEMRNCSARVEYFQVTWQNGFCAATFFPAANNSEVGGLIVSFLAVFSFGKQFYHFLCGSDKDIATILFWTTWQCFWGKLSRDFYFFTLDLFGLRCGFVVNLRYFIAWYIVILGIGLKIALISSKNLKSLNKVFPIAMKIWKKNPLKNL